MTILGTAIRRTEDQRLLTGNGKYVANLSLPDALHVVFVTSPAAHAHVTELNTREAKSMAGVIAVVTAADLNIGPLQPLNPNYPPAMARPLLAKETVRFVGEPLAAVVCESISAAMDAAEAVQLDFEPLPTAVDVGQAVRDRVLLYPEAGTNVVLTEQSDDYTDDPLDNEVIVRATFHSQRIAPCPLETRSAASMWDEDGRLTHWSSCQGAHPARDLLCEVYALSADRVRLIVPDVGGSFGAKGRLYPEEVLLPWLAAYTGRPVRWHPFRSSDMVGLGHSRVQVQRIEMGGRRDGLIETLRVHLLADAGAYPLLSPRLAHNTGLLSPGAYAIKHTSWKATTVVTNTTPTTAYRGAGRPEAAALLERVVDMFAAKVGVDPAKLRYKNFIAATQFPYRSSTGAYYDSGNYASGLDAALSAAGYEALRDEQARRRERGSSMQVGIGIATFIDRTAAVPGSEYGSVELEKDGRITLRTGSTPFGQGHETTWAMIVADRTGLPLERIAVLHGDTDSVPRGSATGGSRSVQKAGSAVAVATDALIERARHIAADLLEASSYDMVFDPSNSGRFHVAGTSARFVTWDDLAEHVGPADELRCEADVEVDPSFPSGSYIAVVEVDTETGEVRLNRLVTVDDAGNILNPLLAEGQVHGGAAQGVAQALFEEFVYDRDGNPLTTTFADYGFPAASELPSFESIMLTTPSPNNPLGAKGIAESGTIGAPPAVQNAVLDALSHLGVQHIDMPCTPERIWRAIVASQESPTSSDQACDVSVLG